MTDEDIIERARSYTLTHPGNAIVVTVDMPGGGYRYVALAGPTAYLLPEGARTVHYRNGIVVAHPAAKPVHVTSRGVEPIEADFSSDPVRIYVDRSGRAS